MLASPMHHLRDARSLAVSNIDPILETPKKGGLQANFPQNRVQRVELSPVPRVDSLLRQPMPGVSVAAWL